jgi:8-oxo-dGTP pyrophosphatase MutT (NUDIX family)
VRTALREAEEEIGIDARDIEVVGQLSRLYIPPSNFSVQPVVAVSHSTPRFLADSREVARILTLPFADFLDEKKRKEEFWEQKGMSMITPFFHIQDHVIWGATAMMMSELIYLVKEA